MKERYHDWAQVEFGEANFGDQRLKKRLVELARQRGAHPHGSVAESCGGLAGGRAAYRFYDNEKVSMEQIQLPHRKATIKRLAEHEVVLAVQDTTQVDLSAHPHTAGVGYLDDLYHTGFLLHTTLMVTPQREPLGIIQQQIIIRDPAEFGKAKQRWKKATAEKESQKWLTSLQAMAGAQAELPQTRLVSVGDSEADIYALFAEAKRLGQFFLVRACRDRIIEHEEERHLWQHVGQQPLAGTLEVAIPRQENRPARTALLSVRFAEVTLRVPPLEKARLDQPELTAWAIWVSEETPPPDGQEPIEWKLLTNVPTYTFEQAAERVNWYACRWVVEMFHKVLKSGCRLEERQFDDLENTKRFLAIDSIVAWRVLHLTLFSRQAPDLSCETILETYEWQALYCFLHKTSQPPEKIPTLGEVLTWIARLGGFMASQKHPPGTTVIWRGFSRLTDIAQAWLVFHPDTS
jgi:hypothetical protein